MFKNILNLKYKRNFIEVIGFYIFALIVFMASKFLFDLVFLRTLGPIIGFQFVFEIKKEFPVIFSLFISFLILDQKELIENYKYILVALLAVFLTVFAGNKAGLIVTAYLSTVEKKEVNK